MKTTQTTDTRINALLPGRSVRLSNGKADPKVGELWAERSCNGDTLSLVRIRKDGFTVISRQKF